MLKNPSGSPGPEAGAIPDGLEVNEDTNYSAAPQTYHQHAAPQQHQPYYDHAQTPQTQYTQTTHTNNKSDEKRSGTICGMRKATFFMMLIALFLLAALVAIAGALGAMLAQKNSEIADLMAATPSTSGTSGTSSPAAAFDLSKPAPTDTPIRKGQCPTSSSTPSWTVPGTNLTFHKDCGTDYKFNDITSLVTANIEECIRLCAMFNLNPQKDGSICRGVGYLTEDTTPCWLKSTKNNIDDDRVNRLDAESAWI